MVHGNDKRGRTGDFSATSLSKCPRMVFLGRGGAVRPGSKGLEPHGHPESPQDFFYRFKGTATHAGVEQITKDLQGVSTEERIYKEIEVDGEIWIVSGKHDLRLSRYHGEQAIEDYKTSGKKVQDIRKPDDVYIRQANVYCWTHWGGKSEKPGSRPEFIRIKYYTVWYLANDGIKKFRIDLDPIEETEEWIRNQIRALTSSELPPILPPREWRGKELVNRKCTYCPLKELCYSMEGLTLDGNEILKEGQEPEVDHSWDAWKGL